MSKGESDPCEDTDTHAEDLEEISKQLHGVHGALTDLASRASALEDAVSRRAIRHPPNA